jgi:hypothetical protein
MPNTITAQTRKTSFVHKKIYEWIKQRKDKEFTASEIVAATGIDSAKVCRFLAYYAKRGYLLQKGEDNDYTYTFVKSIPIQAAKGEVSDAVWQILLKEFKLSRFLTEDQIYDKLHGTPYSTNSIRTVVYRWKEHGFLIEHPTKPAKGFILHHSLRNQTTRPPTVVKKK